MTVILDRLSERLAAPRNPIRFASPLDYGRVVMPKMIRTPALELMNDALVDVQEGRCDRLIITMAPQETKSTTCTRFFIGSSLVRQPESRWGIASYSDRLARGWSRRIRNDITGNSGRMGAADLGLRLAPDQKAADEWLARSEYPHAHAAHDAGRLEALRDACWAQAQEAVTKALDA